MSSCLTCVTASVEAIAIRHPCMCMIVRGNMNGGLSGP